MGALYVAVYPRHHPCLQGSGLRHTRRGDAIDGIHHHLQGWHVERHGRVAQEGILQTVGRLVALRYARW